MGEFIPTRAQLLAKNYDRHMSVTANAGSGKTKILTERYLEIIIDNYKTNTRVDPKEITALTFTKKAAGEMLERITTEVEKMIARVEKNKKSENSLSIGDLRNIRLRLTSAPIRTFHSFARSILKDYPLEAGINPAFSELDDVDKEILFRNAVRDAIELRLSSDNDEEKNQITDFIRLYGISQLQEFIRFLAQSKSRFLRQKKIFENSDEYFLKLYFKKTTEYLLSDLQVLKGIIDDLSSEPKAKVNVIAEAVSATEHAMEVLTLEPAGSPKIEHAFEVLEKSLSEKFRGNKGIKGAVEDLKKDFVCRLSAVASCLFAGGVAAAKQSIAYSRYLLGIAEEVFEEVENEKKNAGVLDFEDMIIGLRDLLVSKPDVAEKIRCGMKYLMVDEFQDTNELQYDIVKALVPSLSPGCDCKYPKLFIVGDAKQSIYGFRNADVRVFSEAVADIKKSQMHLAAPENPRFFSKDKDNKLKPNDDELLGDISLNASFRMKPVPALFINDVFSEIMAQDVEDEETRNYFVSYDKLVCGRADKGVDYVEKAQKKMLDKDCGSVDFIVFKEKERDEVLPTDLPPRTKAVAEHIAHVTRSEKQFEYRDIAIISRTKGNFTAIGDTLSEYGIPFKFESGSDFFATDEVRDITAFLKFLYNRHDNLAFAQVMKSDYFRFHDTGIFTLKNYDANMSIWENLESFVSASNSPSHPDFGQILSLYSVCESLFEFSSRLPVPTLIKKIEQLTRRSAKVSNLKKKMRIENNIGKYVDIASEFDEKGYPDLGDFIEYIERKTKVSAEGEAIEISDDNSVKILTMHAAKGLQFPCVIFAEPDKNFLKMGNAEPIMEDETYGIALSKIKNEEFGGITSEISEHPAKTLIKKKAEEKQFAEEIRLMYVLMTRAETSLVLPTGYKIKKDKKSGSESASVIVPNNSYIKLVFDALNIDADTFLDRDELRFVSNELKILRDAKEYDFANPAYRVGIHKYDSDEPIAAYLGEAAAYSDSIPEILLGNIYSPEKDYLFSATKMTVFNNDIENFAKVYLLGMDNKTFDENNRFYPDESVGGKDIGTIIHLVLSDLKDFFSESAGEVDTKKLEESIERNITATQSPKKSGLRERIRADINHVLNSELLQSGRYDIDGSLAEFEMVLPYGSDFLTTVVDLIVRDTEADVYEIWDWKTNTLSSKKEVEEKVEYYRPQMELYAYFLSKKYPGRTEYPARLIFTNPKNIGAAENPLIFTFNFTAEDIAEYESKKLRETVIKMKKVICMDLPPVDIAETFDNPFISRDD